MKRKDMINLVVDAFGIDRELIYIESQISSQIDAIGNNFDHNKTYYWGTENPWNLNSRRMRKGSFKFVNRELVATKFR